MLNRRRLLIAALALPAAGCAPDPRIDGGPTTPWTPIPTGPEQTPAAATATRIIVALATELDLLESAARQWENSEGFDQWLSAMSAMTDTHLQRLLSANPLGEVDPVFEPPVIDIPPAEGSRQDVEQWWRQALDTHIGELSDVAVGVTEQPLALLYGSLAIAVVAGRAQTVVPEPGDAEPLPFAEVAATPSTEVALSHAWALIRGLEIGLGNPTLDADLDELGTARLPLARQQRDELRALLDAVPEQSFTWQMPTPMQTSAEIRQGWAILETNLLDAMARMFVATRERVWLDAAVEQGQRVLALGQPLTFWPGWTGT